MSSIAEGDGGIIGSKNFVLETASHFRDRKIFIAFTVLGNLIRVISARDMTNTEKRKYKRYEK